MKNLENPQKEAFLSECSCFVFPEKPLLMASVKYSSVKRVVAEL